MLLVQTIFPVGYSKTVPAYFYGGIGKVCDDGIRSSIAPPVQFSTAACGKTLYLLPVPWKSAYIICPLPKVKPPVQLEKHIRPITLTPVLTKVLESFTCKWVMDHISEDLDSVVCIVQPKTVRWCMHWWGLVTTGSRARVCQEKSLHECCSSTIQQGFRYSGPQCPSQKNGKYGGSPTSWSAGSLLFSMVVSRASRLVRHKRDRCSINVGVGLPQGTVRPRWICDPCQQLAVSGWHR